MQEEPNVTDANDATQTAETGRPLPEFIVTDETGALAHGQTIIGSIGYHDDGRPMLTLDLGWMRLAGVALTVLDDAHAGDRHRNGVTLAR